METSEIGPIDDSVVNNETTSILPRVVEPALGYNSELLPTIDKLPEKLRVKYAEVTKKAREQIDDINQLLEDLNSKPVELQNLLDSLAISEQVDQSFNIDELNELLKLGKKQKSSEGIEFALYERINKLLRYGKSTLDAIDNRSDDTNKISNHLDEKDQTEINHKVEDYQKLCRIQSRREWMMSWAKEINNKISRGKISTDNLVARYILDSVNQEVGNDGFNIDYDDYVSRNKSFHIKESNRIVEYLSTFITIGIRQKTKLLENLLLCDPGDTNASNEITMTKLTNDILPDVERVSENLSNIPMFREISDRFHYLIKATQESNRNLGNNEELFIHNATDDYILKSILENGICSRREAIKKGLKIQFQQGSDSMKVFMDSSGLTLGDRLFSWNEVEKKSKLYKRIEGVGKHWAEEFDEVLFENRGHGPYYSGDWAVVLPAREIRMNYQFTDSHDGVHVFNRNYDQQESEKDITTGVFHPETNSCNVDLNQHHFLIIMSENGLKKFHEYLINNFSKLPNPNKVKTIEEWIDLHIVEVDKLHKENDWKRTEENWDQIKKVMFNRFKIKSRNGVKVDSGNKGFMAGSRIGFATYLYI